MKSLIVAHPDDEILWFDPLYFDKIFIVFCNRHDKKYMGEARLKVIADHPLSHKIELIGLNEPGYWKDKTRSEQYLHSHIKLKEILKELSLKYSFDEVFTHNKVGEYGHSDHILVHNSVVEILTHQCKGNIWFPTLNINKSSLRDKLIKTMEINLSFFEKVRSIYNFYNAWTWKMDYSPAPFESFYCD